MREKLLWWAVVLIGIVATVVFISRTPSQGKITYQKGKFATPSPMEYIRYDAPNFSFAYENKYELSQKPVSGNMEGNWELVGNKGVNTHMVLTLNKVISGDIEEVSGVIMRRLKNDIYNEEVVRWGKTEGVLFVAKDGSELTAFFIREGKVITVSMTANTNDQKGLRDEFQKLVDSMQIKVAGGP